MQTLVSKTFRGDEDFTIQSKRFKANTWNNTNELVTIPKKAPIERLKLQFPNLNEESLEGILKECDNDVIKAIKKLYADKTNSFSSSQQSNQENRFIQSNSSFGENSYQFKRKRKFNDMSCDMDVTYNFEDSRAQDSKSSMSIANSPVSQKNEMNEDEEEKEMNSSDNNDELLTICSEKLLNELKLAQSEDYAIGRIQECMKEYTLKNNAQINSQSSISKHKYTVKEKRIVSDAIKKLLSDNVILKSAIRKLVDKNEKNRAKVEKYEELENEYLRLKQENEKLHNSIDILKYAVKDKCLDTSYYRNSFGGNNGGAGVF